MWHNVLLILPMFLGWATVGALIMGLALWASTAAETHDEWLFLGEGADHDE